MAAAKNPKIVFNAYKTNCGNKIRKIEDFITAHANIELNTEKAQKLKELNVALKEQFARMELAWDNTLPVITEQEDLTAIQEIINDADKAVEKMLRSSKKFLEDNSVRTSNTNLSMGQTSHSGPPKIVDSLKLKEPLSEEMNLEEANQWFKSYRAHLANNKGTLEKQDIQVQRTMLEVDLDPKMASLP